MIGQGSLGFLLGGLGPCLILLARDFSIPRGRLSWLSAGFGAGQILAGLIGERVLRLGAWPVLRFSAATIVLGGTLLSLAAGVPMVQAGALLLGVGGAGVILVTPVLLAGPRCAADMAYANATNSVGGIVSPLVIGVAQAFFGHGRAALLLAVPGLLLLLAVPHHERSLAPVTAGPHEGRMSGRARLPALRASLALVGAIAPEFFFVIWGAARLQDSGLSAAAASATAAAFPIGLACGRLVAPRFIGRVPVIDCGIALAVTGTLLAAAQVGSALTAAGVALAGLGIAPLNPLLVDQLVRTTGLDLRRSASLAAFVSGVAVLGAPYLLSALAAVVSLRLGFLGAVPLLVAVLLLRRRERAGDPGTASGPAAAQS